MSLLMRSVTRRRVSSSLQSLSSTIAKPQFIIPASLQSAACAPSRSFSDKPVEKGGVQYEEEEDLVLKGRQFELALLGNFPDTPTVQPFGTMDRPSMIYSGYKSRIVGCIGGGPYTHRLQWFTLKYGKKHVCSHCGQVFKLVTDDNFEEVKDLVDVRTREFWEYYNTLYQGRDGRPITVVKLQVGPHSKY